MNNPHQLSSEPAAQFAASPLLHSEEQKWRSQETGKSPAARYDWSGKWLKGDEYHYILSHADDYCEACDFKKFPQKTHPTSIYLEPQSKHVNMGVIAKMA